MTSKIRLLTLSLLLLVGLPAFSSESPDVARMSQEAWAAFECSGLAGVAEMNSEQESLAGYGYDQGKAFLGAYLSGKVSSEDIVRDVPLPIIVLATGPNADFMLGRMYEVARRAALQDVNGRGGEEDVRKAAAREKYERKDCGRLEAKHPAMHAH